MKQLEQILRKRVFNQPLNKVEGIRSLSSDQQSMGKGTTRIKRFYKKVEVKEHPIMDLLEPKDFLQAGLAVPAGTPIGLDNMSKIREGQDVFYAVTLDGKTMKTMYKDPLYIPSRALALAIAEEWESQVGTIDMRQMHINNMIAKAVKSRLDPSLEHYMKNEILKVITNDQVCFIEPESDNEYKEKLRVFQKERIEMIFEVLDKTFEIKLKTFDGLNIFDEQPAEAVARTEELVSDLDYFVLNSLFQVTIGSKSSAIALALIHGGHISVEQAVRLARIDEDFQTKYFGVVQGAHDLDEAYLYSVFSTAKTIVNLSALRDF